MSRRVLSGGRCPALLCVVASLQTLGLARAAGQLPSEATLPGQAVVASTLPAETVLPDSMLPPVQPVQVASQLPSEKMLPVAAPPPAEPARLPRPVDQPWLRLNMPGHTGTIRALVFTLDSQRLCSAGEDKDVHVWMRSQDPQLARREWLHERTVRWQVQRGPRGHIRCLAAGPGLLALAGDGAMGGNGEILLVDPANGTLRRPLVDLAAGHRRAMNSLSFAPGGSESALASVDEEGHALLWRPDPATGLWQPTEIDPPDHVKYGAAEAARLAPFRGLGPLVHAGPQLLAIPSFGKQWTKDVPKWDLDLYRIADGVRQTLPAGGNPHYSLVTALAASGDHARLASADARGQVFLWDLRTQSLAHRFQQPGATVSFCFDPTGNWLAAGSARTPSLDGQARVQLWDVSDLARPRKAFERRLPDDVEACAISPDGTRFAYSQHNGIAIHQMDRLQEPPVVLRPPVEMPLKVAFAKEQPYYRIAFGTRRAANGSIGLTQTFDPRQLQLGKQDSLDPQDWIRESWWSGPWRVRRQPSTPRDTFWLYRGDVRQGQLPLVPDVHGAATAWCWIPDRRGEPWAVAVGTDVRNNIYVFQLARQGICPLVRQFRGHTAAVTSLGVSRDLRYLVSGSEDATIAIWKLQGADRQDALNNRWGAAWHIEDDQLVATRVAEDGPLYFRGMRDGDVLDSLAWIDKDQQRQEVTTPPQMLAALAQTPFDVPVVFQYVRNRLQQPGLQMFPAWQQVVSLFVSTDRQWAYWSPAGYYDASFDGHKLFGWQMNRGVDVLPDYFLAAQMRRELERPQVMEKLLDAGSLEAAFRSARLEPPAESHETVSNQYWLKPHVEILQPAEGQQLDSDRAVIKAAVTVRHGQQIVPPKAFANGVVAIEPQQIQQQAVPEGRTYVYQWQSRLPSERRIMIQVVAATEDEVADTAAVTVYRTQLPPRPPGRLYVFAMGINHYQDPQIQSLDYASRNAQEVADVLKKGSALLYHCQPTALLDESGTRPLWTVVTEEYASRLRDQVSPDDLLLVFLSGHGLRDPDTRQYFYVTADAKFADVMAQRYDDCISFADFGVFSEIPCRKLVILDTCHAGAIQQPLRQQDLKAALRALQDDVVFTMTASEGDQEALEEKEKRLGRFTSRLVEALDGLADRDVHGGDNDGIVTLNEAITYVKRTVTDDSATGTVRQYPTAGPIDLLEFVPRPAHTALNWYGPAVAESLGFRAISRPIRIIARASRHRPVGMSASCGGRLANQSAGVPTIPVAPR